ncbi:MAG: hypothetical protein LUH15_18965 [Tannerellaceae bacterium]|nr:hypothetical protein [Tannerellaceae bacterium]
MPYLDYSLWNPVAQLDTLPYYRFHYPEEDKPFIYTELVPGGITQFAPFVMENGTICPVYLIKCNDSIVWSSRKENKKIYSFPVEAGKKHTILLYLDKQSITIETEPDFF